MPLLEMRDLRMVIDSDHGQATPLRGVSFHLEAGQTMGLVGESGSGKSLTCLSILRLLPPGARVVDGEILFRGQSVLDMSRSQVRRLRGGEIAMILQDPMTSLNPVFTIGNQIDETLRQHVGVRGQAARKRSVDLLDRVGIPDAEDRHGAYPHQLSGGMRQRVAGAIGIAGDPSLLIADEPTTALDVTIQAQYLGLLRRVRAELGAAMIFVTHDLGIVGHMCDTIAVMYAGRIVEYGETQAVFRQPLHPYTAGLLESLPSLAVDRTVPLRSIPGTPPDPTQQHTGCAFAPRCPLAIDDCDHLDPSSVHAGGRSVACLRVNPADPQPPHGTIRAHGSRRHDGPSAGAQTHADT